MANLASALGAVAATPRDIVQLRFYVVDWDEPLGLPLVKPVLALLTEDYGVVNRPLTTLVPVPKLALHQVKFEIRLSQLLAVFPGPGTHQMAISA